MEQDKIKSFTESIKEKYPDVVENKVNEFAKKIKEMPFDNREFAGKTFQEAAARKVSVALDTELAEVIKKTKDGIDNYAKNYFARNLFKAMNLMDGVLGADQEKLS